MKKFLIGMSSIMLLSLAILPGVASAEGENVEAGGNLGPTDFGLGNAQTSFNGTLGSNTTLTQTIANLLNVGLSLLGLVAVIIVIIGGFKWMTAGGNDEKADEGRKFIVSGVIGMAIILSAFAITRFVLGSLSKATGSGQVNGQY